MLNKGGEYPNGETGFWHGSHVFWLITKSGGFKKNSWENFVKESIPEHFWRKLKCFCWRVLFVVNFLGRFYLEKTQDSCHRGS